MSDEKNIGGIVFEVSLETSKMLSAQEQVNKSLDNMDDGFNRNAKSASNLESGMTKLASAIKLVMAAAALRGLADMVQRYQEMSERVQMATSSQSEFEQVQQRLLKTANGTYRSLSEAQELYITTAASLRSMNYTTDQAIDVQDSMSYAFVKNATSADRANGAISAFSKSMNKGKVEADSWETIIAAIPSVIDDIATASGKTSAQIRSLGSSGKITANQLSEGLRQSLEANSAAAAGMSNNLTDAGVRMKTAITAILVETEKGTGALQSLTNGIISAADALLNFSGDTQNMPKVIDAITISAMALAAVMSSRLVGALSSATVAQAARTKETISGMIATRAAAVADESAANASARKAAADKSAAMSSLSAAQAELNAMKATTVSTNATIANAEAELASIKVNLQQIQAEKALEIQRARSQITEQGRIATATRMAQLRQAEVLLTQQMARAEAVVTNARATAIATAEAKISAARIAASNATGAAVTANNALAASQSRLAATSISVSSALRVVNTALAPLGGAVGVVAIVAAGWYLYAQQQEQARKESIEFANTLPDVISKLKEMNLVQAQGVRADTIESIKNQEAAIGALKDEIAELSSRYKDAKNAAENSAKGTWLNNDATETAAELAGQLAKKNRDLYEQQDTLKNSTSALQQINVQLNQGILDQMKAARDNALAVAELEKKTSLLGGSQAFLAEKLGLSTTALQKFNAESLKIDWGGEAGEKLINQAERRLALSKLEGKEKAKQQALYDAEDAKVTDPLAIKQLQDAYAQTEANSEAKKTLAKETAAATKEESAAEAAEKRRVKSLQDLSNEMAVAELKTKGLNREAAQLAAVQDLGAGASQQQIQQATQQAGQIFDIQQRMADKKAAIDADSVAKAEQQRKLDLSQLDRQLAAGNISFEQAQQRRVQIAADYSKSIAEASASKAVTPQQDLAAQADPVQALANENARKLALIQQFTQQKVITEQQGLALMNAANTQYEQARIAAQWEIFRNQSAGNESLAAAFDSLAGNASNAFTGIITQSMTADEAMRSLASNAVNSLINGFVQMGVEWVKSAIMGQTAQVAATATTTAAAVAGTATTTAASVSSAAATTTAWTPAAIVASIGSFGGAAAIGIGAVVAAMALSGSLSGKRKNGGPVSAGSMYQVGEGGMPEIYQAGTGKQYMIPGDNGKVISNKDMQGSGSAPNVSIQFIDQSTGRKSFDAQSSMSGNNLTVTAFISDLEEGGPMSQSITRNTTASRRANG
ncbi:tape measure protein [Yersinia enterocolitica]